MAEEEIKEELVETPQAEEVIPQTPEEQEAAAQAAAAEGGAAPAAEGAESQQELPATPLARYTDRLGKAYPDRKFGSEDEISQAMDEYLSELESYRENGELANEKLISVFNSDPVVSNIVGAMTEGASFREALARHVDPTTLIPEEGDPDYEGWKKNMADRESAYKKQQALLEERNKNLELSQQELENFAQENGMDEKSAADFLTKVDTMIGDMINDIGKGRVSKELLVNIKKMLDYDNDIAKVRETAAVADKNKEIVAGREKEKPKGDGIPKLSSSSELPETHGQAGVHHLQRLLDETNRKRVL